MKIEKYALLDTDFISKTHFIHGDTEKCLVDLVVEMPGYCFFCHSQIIKELSRHNQQAIGWLQHKISEQKIQCYTDEEILNELVKIRGDFACSTYTLMLKDACDAFSKSYFKEHYQTLENFDVVTSTKQDYLETLQKADDEIGKHNSFHWIHAISNDLFVYIFQFFLPSLLQPVFSFSDFTLSRRENFIVSVVFSILVIEHFAFKIKGVGIAVYSIHVKFAAEHHVPVFIKKWFQVSFIMLIFQIADCRTVISVFYCNVF